MMPLLGALLGIAVGIFVGVSPAQPSSATAPTQPSALPYRVLQMNLCLSGVARCFASTAYPAIVDEAAEQIIEHDPDAVTLNEGCSGDAALLARRTGYHMRFSAVLIGGAQYSCVRPKGRGVFGIAVLSKEPIIRTRGRAFTDRAGAEQRRWICARTTNSVHVCTAHLDTRGSEKARRANDAECAELRGVLARHDAAGVTVFGGDVNRRNPCAPTTMRTADDAAAARKPGIQHVYVGRSQLEPSARVEAAVNTDHDFLLVDGALDVPGCAPANTRRAHCPQQARPSPSPASG